MVVFVSGAVAGGTVGTVAGTVACDIREALAVTVTGTGTALLHSTERGLELELGLALPIRTTRYWDGLRSIVIIVSRPRFGYMHCYYKPSSSINVVG